MVIAEREALCSFNEAEAFTPRIARLGVSASRAPATRFNEAEAFTPRIGLIVLRGLWCVA